MASFEERKQVFVDFVDSVEGYELIDEGQFVNSKTKVEIKHEVCGTIWGIRPHDFKNKGNRCSSCANKTRGAASKARAGQTRIRWSNKKIQCWLDKNRPGWKITGEYQNSLTPTEFTCDQGHEITMNWNSLKDNRCGCGTCFQEARTKTTAQFEKEMCKASDFQYVLVSEYVNNATKVDLLHLVCGEIYSVVPRNFLSSGRRCSCENGWYGEGYTAALLKENNVEFVEQKTFDDLRDKGLLRFDFHLPEFNTCIEIQGRQHYEAVDFYGGEEKFKDQQHKDQMKRDYCEANGIKLIELPYFCKKDAENFRCVLEKEGIL